MALIEEQKLAGGMVVTIHDESRRLAADRWLVKIRCEVTLPLPAECLCDLAEEDIGLKAAVLSKLGDSLSFLVVRERNFIDAQEKAAVVAGMVASVRENMVGYLANPHFPARLFARRYRELRESCLVERHYHGLAAAHDEDGGPADFSAIFRK